MTYTKSARFYDAIYSFKDYEAEAKKVHEFIQQYASRDCQTLLDVATGTGAHLPFLQKHYTVEGLDLEPGMLEAARKRLPDVTFHKASMVDFDLGKQFDVITCLFSAIGYALTIDDLNQTLTTFAKHLHNGGVAIIEPWLDPAVYQPGTVHATFVDETDLKISRMVRSEREGDIAVMPMHYMVATPEEGVVYFVETHRLRLFTPDQYLNAIWQAGLTAHLIGGGLTNRGLYVGVKD